MAHFDDVVLPDRISYGSSFTPQIASQQVRTISGQTFTNRLWSEARRSCNLNHAGLTASDRQDLLNLWTAVQGPSNSWQMRDWSDWNTTATDNLPGDENKIAATDQPLRNTADQSFLGDGVTQTFQCVKRYQIGSAVGLKTIKTLQDGTTLDPPLSGQILVAEDGVPTGAFAVALATGIVTFTTAPALGVAPTWGGAFYLPVKFAEDEINFSIEGFDDNQSQIPVEEVVL